MEGILDNLTEAQRNTLKQFRENLEDLLHPDHTDYILVKFLRTKNFNLKAAEKIFKVNYYNRITFDINNMLDYYEKSEVARNYEPVGTIGFAKDGTLIRYFAAGRLDLYGFIMSMSCCDLCLHASYIMESDLQILKEQRLKTGKEIHEVTYIVDLEGFTIEMVMHKCVFEMASDFVSLIQDTYPELWRRLLLVNAPKIFHKAFNLFKPVLRAHVLHKTHVADKGSSKELLLKYIDEDSLPVFLGGKRVDSNGDPQCKEFLKFGGKVPEKMYSQNNRIPLSPLDPNVKSFTVPPRSMRNLSVVIREPDTKIRLQFKSEGGSIYVLLLYKEFGPNPDVLELPEEDDYLDETAENFMYKQICVEIRVQAHCTQENALCTCKWPGIYVARFNNSSSWFTSKKLMVKYEIFPQKKQGVP